MKIAVTGANGMLGSAVVAEARKRGHDVTALLRGHFDPHDAYYEDTAMERRRPWSSAGVVINCAGLVPTHPQFTHVPALLEINSLFPHNLALWCTRLIHVSTDCVFSGREGMYSEESPPCPVDRYGITKLAGEVDYGPHLTVRTSFVGIGPRGLLAWFLGLPQGATIEGWDRASWSGLTTLQTAWYLLELAERPDVTGILNIGGEPISKYRLLTIAREVFKRQAITIERVEEPRIDRTLSLRRMRELSLPKAPAHEEMLKELAWQTASVS